MAGRKLGSPAGAAALRACFRCSPRRTASTRPRSRSSTWRPTCRSRCCCRARSTSGGVHRDKLHEPGGVEARSGQGFPLDLLPDSGVDLYSNGVMVSAKLAKEKPEAVKGSGPRHQPRAEGRDRRIPMPPSTLLATKEPLLNKDIEKRRLIYVYKTLIATPEARELGVGDVSDARMTKAITTIAESYRAGALRRRRPRCSTAPSCRPRPIACQDSRQLTRAELRHRASKAVACASCIAPTCSPPPTRR